MIKKVLLVFFMFLFSCATDQNQKSTPEPAKTVATDKSIIKFKMKTIDELASLSVSLALPELEQSQYPVVIMVPGTGLFDADVNLGTSRTKKDLIFVDIENHLLGLGYAVMRFSPRGIFCNLYNQPTCPDCQNKTDIENHFLKNCFNFNVRKGVTPQTMQDDILQIYRWAASQPSLHSKKIVMFGHSEGSIHISKLVKKNLIAPKALIFMGGIAESPSSIIKWQMTDRILESVMSFDANQNQQVTLDEIRTGLPDSLIRFFPVEQLSPPDQYWTRTQLQKLLNEQYEAQKKDVLSKKDTDPFGSAEVVQASYKWWKMWFTDDDTVVDNLKNYKGYVIYNNGSRDSQTLASRQEQVFNKVKKPMWSFITFEGKGHSLGNDLISGPVANDSMLLLMHSFKFEGL